MKLHSKVATPVHGFFDWFGGLFGRKDGGTGVKG